MFHRQLIGPWTLTRRTTDGSWGFTGHAVFVAEGPSTLLYEETGTVRLVTEARSFRGKRRFRYEFTEDRMTIRFADGMNCGRVFVTLAFPGWPEATTADAIHHCDPDLYRVRYTMDLPDRFEVTVEANGPRKAYRLESHYRRAVTIADGRAVADAQASPI